MKLKIIYLASILTYLTTMQNIHCHSEIEQLSLMPFPSTAVLSEGKLRFEKSFNVSVTGLNSERVKNTVNRMLRLLSDRTGYFLSSPKLKIDSLSTTKMVIQFERLGKLEVKEDESYRLVIENNMIELNAPTDIGILRGIATLSQLLSTDESGYYFPNIKIEDKPRFPWRGLMLDVCRHFMPIEVIKRNLDGMAAVKLNVFHWHLSEDQGFRVECKTFPKLHEKGSNGLFYTHKQVKDIISYAEERGIRVIPEFDIPGHSTSWLVGYPELASAPGPYEIERKFGIKDPTFNPTIEETYVFFDKFFKEMSTLFPYEYIHIGGDENNGKHWDENESIQEFMKANSIKDNHELQAYFNNRIQKILAKYDKKIIGWDEILHEDIPKNIVIQSWRGKQALVEAARKGYKGILSNGYYLDLVQPTAYHYLNDPIDVDANLTDQEIKNILGGEATMWTEWVTSANVDSRIWPRMAAIAERFWSPRDINNVDNMFQRLEPIGLYLEELGLTHISFQDKMLRRLSNGNDVAPLKILIDVIEPLQEYKRASSAKGDGFEFTQLSPYTRVIDATIIDSRTVLEINQNTKKIIYKNDLSVIDNLKTRFNQLIQNHSRLLPIINSSPILLEIKPLSENLKELMTVGFEALELFENNKKVTTNWKQNARQIIEKSKISYGQVEIVIVDAVNKLVEALE